MCGKMKFIWKSTITLVFLYLSSPTWATHSNPSNSPRSKRSFGFSNPIFSRVFNPYDNRPLSAKFFGYDDAPQVPQHDSPQYHSLWRSQPLLEEEDVPDETYGRYYPLSSMISKPYPSHHVHKPYPEASKPYPPAKPYPPSPNPCPKPQTNKPPFGKLFVDEVRKNLRFQKDPKTGELVPVITEDRISTQNFKATTERSEEKTETTTAKQYNFRLLPLYDTKTKFNEDDQHQKALKDLKDFEERKKKIVRTFYGTDETKWPTNAFDILLGRLENIKEVEKTPTEIQSVPVFVSSTSRPFFIVQNTLVQNKFQEEVPLGETASASKVTKKPCRKKPPQRDFLVRYPYLLENTERSPQLNIQVITNHTKPNPFSLRINSHNSRTSEDYTQFLAPPATIIYQKFNSDSSPVQKTSTIEPFTSPTQSDTNSPSFFNPEQSRAIEFRVFNEKLDQEALDSFKDPATGKLDPSKLEAATHTVLIEPVSTKNVKFQTLESRKLNVLSEFFEESKNYENSRHFSVSEPAKKKYPLGEWVPSTKTVLNGLDSEKNKYLEQVLGNEGIHNIGDIHLDRNKIWDSDRKVLTDSYGRILSKN